VALKALHGWPTRELSTAITTYYVLGATLLFFWVGPLFDRHGARKVVVLGTVAMACAGEEQSVECPISRQASAVAYVPVESDLALTVRFRIALLASKLCQSRNKKLDRDNVEPSLGAGDRSRDQAWLDT
jgi:MFS family permease